MITQIARWGNSLALRIPSAFAKQTHIADGQSVDVSLVEGKLVISPIETSPVFELEALLSKISPENIPNERDFLDSPPIGKEIW